MMNEVTAADGHVLDCWIEPAQGQRRSGLVILQEIFGVTDQLKGVARRYAKLGHEVAIPALFDRVERGLVIAFDEGARGREIMLSLALEDTMRDIAAAVDTLAEAGGKVGVMGFCWGGGVAIGAAGRLEIGAAVSFYGTRLERYLDRPLRAPLLCHFGTRDDHTPPERIEALRRHAPEAEIHLYEAGHAFANDARPAAHVPEAAELAHRRTEAFLARHLQGE